MFTHKKKLIPEYYFERMYEDIKDKVFPNFERKSCVYNLHDIDLFPTYREIPKYKHTEIPKSLEEIRTIVEKDSGEIFDYVLVHIYSSGNAAIGWHFDREALNSEIASISLGATRKFRLKEIGRKKGWDYEFSLCSGDCIYMHKPCAKNNYVGCQSKYFHCVPKELTVKKARINLTFRQYEL